jgi:hypothetical protein
MDLSILHPKLKDNYIIRELEKSSTIYRSESVIRLLTNLDDRVPMAKVDIYGYGWLPEKEEFEDHARYTRDFFKYVSDIELVPEDKKALNQLIKKAEDNEKKSRWFYTKYRPLKSKIPRLPHHQLPPYIYEWKESILGKYYQGDLKNLDFTKKVLGNGGFSCVYLVNGQKGEKYALKLFHPSWKFPMERRAFVNEKIVENVKEKQTLLAEFPSFPKVRAFNPEMRYHEGPEDPWYMMDFVEGKPAKRRLLGKGPIDDSLKKSALKGYAEMLRFLHSKNNVFYDNNWGAMMIDGSVSFVDFDFVTKEGEKPPMSCGTICYVSESQMKKEPEPAMKSIDLEGFAKMIDHLYFGKPLISNTEEFRKFEEKRKYPVERKQKLPKELGDIVEQVLIEPKSDISINDFCSAIEKVDA